MNRAGRRPQLGVAGVGFGLEDGLHRGLLDPVQICRVGVAPDPHDRRGGMVMRGRDDDVGGGHVIAAIGENGGRLAARVVGAVADVRRLIRGEPALRVDRHERHGLLAVADEERPHLQRVVDAAGHVVARAVPADVHRRVGRDVDHRGPHPEQRVVRLGLLHDRRRRNRLRAGIAGLRPRGPGAGAGQRLASSASVRWSPTVVVRAPWRTIIRTPSCGVVHRRSSAMPPGVSVSTWRTCVARRRTSRRFPDTRWPPAYSATVATLPAGASTVTTAPRAASSAVWLDVASVALDGTLAAEADDAPVPASSTAAAEQATAAKQRWGTGSPGPEMGVRRDGVPRDDPGWHCGAPRTRGPGPNLL